MRIFVCFSEIMKIDSGLLQEEGKSRVSMDKVVQEAQIIRNKYTKEASLILNVKGSWSLYAGHAVENINDSAPILTGNGGGTFPLTVSTSIRIYFILETETKRILLAERHLPMEGGYNFRDLGGFKTKEGRYTKWGKLFRADELSNLTESDLKYLTSIPITSVIDFRAQAETRRSPDKLPPTVQFTYPIAITPGNLSTEGIQANLLKTNIDSHMKHMNRLLVSDPACVRSFRLLFFIVRQVKTAPEWLLLWYCYLWE